MNNQCEGCLLLEQGLGGENQLAHMFPGGCLYTEDEEYLFYGNENNSDNDCISDDTIENSSLSEKSELKLKELAKEKLANENLQFLDNSCKHCIICKFKLSDLNKSVCESCEKKKEQLRYVRYTSFRFNKYEDF